MTQILFESIVFWRKNCQETYTRNSFDIAAHIDSHAARKNEASFMNVRSSVGSDQSPSPRSEPLILEQEWIPAKKQRDSQKPRCLKDPRVVGSNSMTGSDMEPFLPQETRTANGPGQFEQFRHLLTASPALYPIAVDPHGDLVQLIHVRRADYRSASFLDSRLLAPDTLSAWRPWVEVRRAAAGLAERCHFIFHISHAGSTLLSRLLGHHPNLFSLREPALLRYLADIHLTLGHPSCPWSRTEFDDRLAVYLALWSRTFEPSQTALIKATSFVSEMSEHLMERVGDSRASVCSSGH